MKFIVNIIVLFCLFSLCFTQISPYCANDRQCNYQASYGLSYCESSSGTCKQRSNVTFKSVLTSNQFACGPDSFSRTGVCIQLAGDNCQYSVLNSIYYQCFGTYNALQGVCTPFTSTDKMSSLNNRCDLNSNPKVVCPLGQYCNNQICRPNIPVGGYCTTQASPLITSNMCAYPSICNRRKCILPFTVPVGGSCESSTACANGVCLNGVCSQATQNPCFNNDDCASYETCPQPTNTDNKGTCTTKILQATLDYNSCLYNKCTSVYGTTETDCIAANCTSEYIRRGCATYCNQHPSVRYDTSYGQFTYYCKDIKRTAWTAPACSQQQESQFTQCEGNSY